MAKKTIKTNEVTNKLDIRKMKNTMWLGLIMGFVTISLVLFVIIQEFISATPNMLIIVIDVIAFGLGINLIYNSWKTRNELRKEMQNDILKELEREWEII